MSLQLVMGHMSKFEKNVLPLLGRSLLNLIPVDLTGTFITYRPFHKTLPRSSVFINWISVRFYETAHFIKPYRDPVYL